MSWIVDVALGALGLSDADKATVEAAIPIADALINHYNANTALFNTMIADVQALAPAAKIIADAMAAKGVTTSQLLTHVSHHGEDHD